MDKKIKIFIGTDRSQLLPAKVLEHSIRKTASQTVEVQTMDKLQIPEPIDLRQSQRTGFSFARWALPELCHYKGRGIYLDADMLVFKDIISLWDMPMHDAVISIVDGTDSAYCSEGVKLNKNETSVMIIDCEKAKWTLKDLVHGLDGQYTYQQMMSELCFLTENKIIRTIPRHWNSMDYWDDTVSLVHFTNTPIQPWVSVDNDYGYVWVDYLKKMINEAIITIQDIEKEVELGYFRPSILREVTFDTCYDPHSAYAHNLRKIDVVEKFIPHREVQEWNIRRLEAIESCEFKLAKQRNLGYYFIKRLKKSLSIAINRIGLFLR